jgi:uncharacterized membrane protein YkvA (DUF1232 family)
MNSQRPRPSLPAGWSWTNLLRDVVATWRLLWDPSVPGLLKMALPFLALLYWISPIDLLPLVPLDDIAVMLVAVRLFVALAPRDSVNRAFNGGFAPDAMRQPGANANGTPRDNGEVIDTTWRVVE